MEMSRAVAALSFFMALAVSAGARSQVPDPDAALAELRQHVLYARYDQAIEDASRLMEAPGLSPADHNQLLEILATAHIANGEDEVALEVLGRLYARDPTHRLSDEDASPRLQSFFARAREGRGAPARVSLAIEVEPLTERRSPAVTARLTEGADVVASVRLAYRQGGESRFTQVLMEPDEAGRVRARIPLLGGRERYRVDYVVEALSPSRFVLAREGSVAEPRQIVVPAAELPPSLAPSTTPAPGESEGGSVLESWWFWTLIGVVVAGGTTAYVLLGPPSEGPVEGSLGTIQLRLE